jgi:hypothetical protein
MPHSDAVEHSAQFVEESDLLLLDGAIAFHPKPLKKPLHPEGQKSTGKQPDSKSDHECPQTWPKLGAVMVEGNC